MGYYLGIIYTGRIAHIMAYVMPVVEFRSGQVRVFNMHIQSKLL